LSSYFTDPEVSKSIFSDPVIAKTLTDEYNQIKEDRETLRNSIFKMTNEDTIHMPINLHRIISNAKRMFEISSRTKTDLKPTDVITKLAETLNNLCVIPGVANSKEKLLIDANHDSTLLTRIYCKSILNSKNVILNERLNSKSLDWILGEVKSKFE
jgi:DNA-directed RNA polymerase II subunit RPB1